MDSDDTQGKNEEERETKGSDCRTPRTPDHVRLPFFHVWKLVVGPFMGKVDDDGTGGLCAQSHPLRKQD